MMLKGEDDKMVKVEKAQTKFGERIIVKKKNLKLWLSKTEAKFLIKELLDTLLLK